MGITEIDRATGLSTNAAFKAPVYCATTANITLAGEQTIDGVTTDESRVLVMDQTDASENGIYVSSTGDWTRAPDFLSNDTVREGTRIWVTDGTTNGATEFVVTTDDPIDIGTTDITIARSVDLVPTTDFATAVHAATEKTALVDADEMGLWDSVSTALRKITWADIKAGIFSALGALLAAATSKTTPVDADNILIADSEAIDATKRLTWANLKAGIWTALGALINGGTGKTTPVDADALPLMDSAASNATKKVTWANLKATLKAYFDTLYEAAGGGDGGWTYQTSTPTSDTDWVTFTGLSAYRTIEFSVHFGSAASHFPGMEARVSGGTWRVIESAFVSVAAAADQYAIVGRIDNFNQAAFKNIVAHAGQSTNAMDASSAINEIDLTEHKHYHASYAEVWDEIRFGDATTGIEGGTVDQRGIAIVKGI